MTIDPSLSKKRSDRNGSCGAAFFMHFGIQVRRNLFRRLLLKKFFDNTLPKGRPQGIEGLKFAAQKFS